MRRGLVLVIRHVPFEHLGSLAGLLEARGIGFHYSDATVLPKGCRGLIVLGGPMSANDDLPFIERELRLLEGAIRERVPVLGICLGAQLLAKALGARVYRNPVKEIGWAPVAWTPAAATDALFHGLGESERVLHWHGETFDLPEGATWLARSEHCRNQAFRFGENAYGLQFHLEVTPDMVSDWASQPANRADVLELPAPLDPHAGGSRLGELSQQVFGRWCDLVSQTKT
jgi:GMP synthase (glutamine-hydrolysing)